MLAEPGEPGSVGRLCQDSPDTGHIWHAHSPQRLSGADVSRARAVADLKGLLMFASLIWLAGCQGPAPKAEAPVPAAPPALQLIEPTPDLGAISALPPTQWQLQVLPVQSDAVLQSPALRWQPLPDKPLPAASEHLRWAQNPPALLDRWLPPAVAAGGVQPGSAGPASAETAFLLQPRLIEYALQQQPDGRWQALIQVDARLFSPDSGEQMTQKLFESRAPCKALDAEGISAAYTAALQTLLQAMVDWTLREGDALNYSESIDTDPSAPAPPLNH